MKTSLVFAEMAHEVRQQADKFDFSYYGNLDAFLEQRHLGMEIFFKDYQLGKIEGRYQGLTSIKLAFPDLHFPLAVSSHYFFAGLEDQDLQFHIDALTELLRVAEEVRIFPVIDRSGNSSHLLGPVLLHFRNQEYGVELRAVPYHLQKNGNAMLLLWNRECKVM